MIAGRAGHAALSPPGEPIARTDVERDNSRIFFSKPRYFHAQFKGIVLPAPAIKRSNQKNTINDEEVAHMKIETLISGKNDKDAVEFEGVFIPVTALRRLMKQGYVSVRPYKEEKTFSLWGKTSTACFTVQEFQEMA